MAFRFPAILILRSPCGDPIGGKSLAVIAMAITAYQSIYFSAIIGLGGSGGGGRPMISPIENSSAITPTLMSNKPKKLRGW